MHRRFLRKRSYILFIRLTPHSKGKLKQLSRVARLAIGEPKKATPLTFKAISELLCVYSLKETQYYLRDFSATLLRK